MEPLDGELALASHWVAMSRDGNDPFDSHWEPIKSDEYPFGVPSEKSPMPRDEPTDAVYRPGPPKYRERHNATRCRTCNGIIDGLARDRNPRISGDRCPHCEAYLLGPVARFFATIGSIVGLVLLIMAVVYLFRLIF